MQKIQQYIQTQNRGNVCSEHNKERASFLTQRMQKYNNTQTHSGGGTHLTWNTAQQRTGFHTHNECKNKTIHKHILGGGHI